jgi:HEAT repeat protein
MTDRTGTTVVEEWPRLVAMRRAGDVEALIGELDNPRSEEAGAGRTFTVRQRAVVLLGKMREPRAGEPIERLLGDSVQSVRAAAAWALGRIGLESSAEALISALDDPDLAVRQRAASSLGDLNSPAAVLPLVDLLEDANPWTRIAAAKSLASIGDRRALTPLRKATRRESLRHPTFRFRLTKAYLVLKGRSVT